MAVKNSRGCITQETISFLTLYLYKEYGITQFVHFYVPLPYIMYIKNRFVPNFKISRIFFVVSGE
jgi:hypothetical protein